jgi:acetyl esterase/lipase
VTFYVRHLGLIVKYLNNINHLRENTHMKTVTKILIAVMLTLTVQAVWADWVDHGVLEFLDKLSSGGGKPLEQLPPKEAREVLAHAQKSAKVDISGVQIKEKIIKVDGKPLFLTIMRPQGLKGRLPVFMFFHGGGWVLGDFKTHERLVRDLVVNSGAVAVFVNYTLSPEAKYPVAINQAYGATKWVADHGKEINVDGKNLAVVGNSVGGNMATVVSLMAKEKGTPAIKFQALLWPVTNANFDTNSYQKFASGYFLTKNMMEWFWDNYTTDPQQREEIYASPLRATKEQLKGLPPTLIQTAENDVLRDEGEAYAQKLDEAGVAVTAVRINGLIHDYGLLNALSQIPGTRSALLQVGQEIKKHLSRK